MKPEEVNDYPDIKNVHYLSDEYRKNYGQCTTGDCYEVNITQIGGDDPTPEEYPGEGGYTWSDEQNSQEVFFGYEGCIRNLVNVWKYYGGNAELDKVSGSGGHLAAVFQGSPTAFVPQEFFAEESDAPYQLNESQSEKQNLMYEQFRESLNPEKCRVDNCIRFTRYNDNTAVSSIDLLSGYILANDSYNDVLYGTKETYYCWTPNIHTEMDDNSPTNVQSALVTCDVCSLNEDETIDYESCNEPDYSLDPPEIAIGYNQWFTNDQNDTNHDGIGDKCSMRVDLIDMHQKHDWSTYYWGAAGGGKGTWWNNTVFQHDFVEGGVIRPSEEGNLESAAVDNRDEYLVRLNTLDLPEGDTAPAPHYMTMQEVIDICKECPSLCKLRTRKMKAQQTLSFRVTGFSTEPIDTTIGACSCSDPEYPACWGGLDYCAHPLDRGWDTANLSDLWTYEYAAITQEYRSTGRPTYPGLRYRANRQYNGPEDLTGQAEKWSGKYTAPQCQNQFDYSPDPFSTEEEVYAIFTPYPSWDELPGTHYNDVLHQNRDGCQEISITYKIGDNRKLIWRHPGHQEPDPDPDAGTMEPEQWWFEAHKTRMRLGIKIPFDVNGNIGDQDSSGRDLWLRQWHSDTETEDEGGFSVAPWEIFKLYGGWAEDQQRPLSDIQLGGADGVVLIERQCDPTVMPPDIDDFFDGGFVLPYVVGMSSWLGQLPEPSVHEDITVFEDSVQGAERKLTSDGVTSQLWSSLAERPQNLFPTSGNGWLEIYPTTTIAAARYGLDNSNNRYPADAMHRVDVVLGGILKNGDPATAIWIRRSWSDPVQFQRLGRSSQLSFENMPQAYVDEKTGRVLACNGHTANLGTGVFELNLLTGEWTPIFDAAGNRLPTSESSIVVRDPVGGRAFILDMGVSGMEISKLSIANDAVTLSPLDATRGSVVPEARFGAAAAYKDGAIWVFGGRGLNQALLGDLWSFDLRSRTWTDRSTRNGPTPRERASLVALHNGNLALFGGGDAYGAVSRDTVWNAGVTADGIVWDQNRGGDGTSLLAIGMPAITDEYRPEARTIYTLEAADTENGIGEVVQVVFTNPAGNLKVVAMPIESSAEPREGAPGPNGVMTLNLHSGEDWRLAVVPKTTEPAPATERSYTIAVTTASQGARIATLNALPLTRFDVAGDRVVAAQWNKLRIYQRTNNTMPQVGSLGMSAAVDVVVDGKYAYVADFAQGLKVVDISNPTSPTIVASEWTLGLPDSIAKSGSRVFLGTGLLGVQVIDVSNPLNPTWVDTICTDDIVVDVSSAGGLLMVSGLLDGVALYSVTLNQAAQRLGTYQPMVWVEDTAYYGGKMYVKGLGDAMEVVDLRDPSIPSRINVNTGAKVEVSGRFGDSIIAVPGVLTGIKVFNVQQQ